VKRTATTLAMVRLRRRSSRRVGSGKRRGWIRGTSSLSGCRAGAGTGAGRGRAEVVLSAAASAAPLVTASG
jgi:hypothetical protein